MRKEGISALLQERKPACDRGVQGRCGGHTTGVSVADPPNAKPILFPTPRGARGLEGLALSRPQFPHFKVERITTQLTATNTHNRLWKEV